MRFIMIALSALLITGCSSKLDYGRAQAAIAMFHSSYNAGDFAGVLDEAAPRLKAMPESRKLPKLLAATRARLGRYEAGTVANWRVNYGLSGTTMTMVYNSRFGSSARAVERFTFAKEDERMRLLGYQINSDAFILP